MKKITLTLALFGLLLSSCNDKWDDYYKGGEHFVSGGKIEVVDSSVKAFLESKPEYSDFYAKLSEYPDIMSNFGQNQKVTVWVVNNDNYSRFVPGPDDYNNNVMKFHMNFMEYSFNDLRNGLQIQTLSGTPHDVIYDNAVTPTDNIYLDFDDVYEADPTMGENAYFIKSYQLNDGVVNEVSCVMIPKVTINEYLRNLSLMDPDFTAICDTIFNGDYMKFDLANSTPIDVNETGNIVYDSVLVEWNTIYDDQTGKINFGNPELNPKMTLILPTNAAVQQFFNEASEMYMTLAGTQMTLQDSLLVVDWLKRAIFFGGIGQFASGGSDNVASAYDGITEGGVKKSYIWKKSIQGGSFNTPIKCSNGQIFTTDYIKMPNYVVLERIYASKLDNTKDGKNDNAPYHTSLGHVHGRGRDMVDVENLFGSADYRTKNAVTDDVLARVPEARREDPTRRDPDAWYIASPNLGNWQQGDSGLPFVWGVNSQRNGIGQSGTYADLWPSTVPIFIDVVPIRLITADPNNPLNTTVVDAEIMQFPVGEYQLWTGGRSSTACWQVTVYFNGNVNAQTGKPNTTEAYPAEVKDLTASGDEILRYKNPLKTNVSLGQYFRAATGKGNGTSQGNIWIHPSEPGSPTGTFRLRIERFFTATMTDNRGLQFATWAMKPTTNNY